MLDAVDETVAAFRRLLWSLGEGATTIVEVEKVGGESVVVGKESGRLYN